MVKLTWNVVRAEARGLGLRVIPSGVRILVGEGTANTLTDLRNNFTHTTMHPSLMLRAAAKNKQNLMKNWFAIEVGARLLHFPLAS